MKLSKTTKGFLALTSAAILTLPALTLTSCSNISQYCIPVMTDKTPFTIESITDPYRDSQYGRYDKEVDGDYSLSETKLQLPTNYLYTSAYDGNFVQTIGSMYGYCNYNMPEWKHYAPTSALEDKYVYNRSNDNDYAWRNLKDSQLNYVNSSTLSSYQNLNIATAVTTVNTTSSYFVTNFNYMNSYLDTIISQKKEEDIKKNLNYIFSGGTKTVDMFDYGDEKGKSYFYQYCLNNANLLSTSASKYKFGPYNVGWAFKQGSGFDGDSDIWKNQGDRLNPYIQLTMQDLSKGDYGFENIKTYTPADNSKPYIFPTNTNITGKYLWDGKSTDNPVYTYTAPDNNPYAKYTYKDNKVSDFASIVNIPMLIRPKHIQSAYYDPSQDRPDSIQPADWLTRNSEINNIREQLNQEHPWKEVKKTIGLTDLTVESLTFDQKTSNNFRATPTDPPTKPYTSWMTTEVAKAYDDNKIDPRFKEWIDKGTIEFGDWVALANYGTFVINFQYKYKDGSTEKTQCIKALLPYFTGFSAIFPAYMLFTNADCYKKINAEDENSGYYIEYSGSGIETDIKDAISALTSKELPNIQKAYKDTSDIMKNNPYFIFTWSFGKLGSNGTEGSIVTDPEAYFDYFNNADYVDYSLILSDTINYGF